MPQTAYFAPPSSPSNRLTQEAVTAEKVALSVSTWTARSQRSSKFRVNKTAAVIGLDRHQHCEKKGSKTLWQQVVPTRSSRRPHDMLCLPPRLPLVLSGLTQLPLLLAAAAAAVQRWGVRRCALWIMCSKRLIKSYDVMLWKLSLATCAPEAEFGIILCCVDVIKSGLRHKRPGLVRSQDQVIQSDSPYYCLFQIPDCHYKASL